MNPLPPSLSLSGDPLFWMIHPVLDRMLVAKRLAKTSKMTFGNFGRFLAFEDEVNTQTFFALVHLFVSKMEIGFFLFFSNFKFPTENKTNNNYN